MENSELVSFAQFIQGELNKVCFETNMQHNHPPLRFIVDKCEYCKTYGNVFCIKDTTP